MREHENVKIETNYTQIIKSKDKDRWKAKVSIYGSYDNCK